MSYIPPRDEIELDLVEIWQAVLHKDKIGMLDSLEALAATDVQHALLVKQVNEKFERALSEPELRDASTIDALADILREDVKQVSFSCLVPMRATGSRTPLFCVHGAGGNIMIFKDLCKRLGDEQPFYGLQSKGLDGDATPLRSVEDMAREYLTEIREVQPHGPYIFAGMCLGGLIAYEMSQQIVAMGEEVALLVLLDARNPTSMLEMDERGFKTQSVFHKIQDKAKQGDLLGVVKRKLGRLKTKVMKKTLWAYKETVSNHFTEKEKRFYRHIWDANAEARKSYSPKPYSGNIVALLAEEAPDGSPRDPKRGWMKLAPQLEVIKIPGRHDTVVCEPQVQVLASSINTRLSKIIPTNT